MQFFHLSSTFPTTEASFMCNKTLRQLPLPLFAHATAARKLRWKSTFFRKVREKGKSSMDLTLAPATAVKTPKKTRSCKSHYLIASSSVESFSHRDPRHHHQHRSCCCRRFRRRLPRGSGRNCCHPSSSFAGQMPRSGGFQHR